MLHRQAMKRQKQQRSTCLRSSLLGTEQHFILTSDQAYTVSSYNMVVKLNTMLSEGVRTATSSDEKNTALRAIGRAQDPKLIKRTLDYSLSKHVKDQDIYLPLAGLRAHKLVSKHSGAGPRRTGLQSSRSFLQA
ncbi:hypothetical protein MRB53_037704 [Persea americana]|nr:hypothetical protein MRB53_037704 [Persea americana]